MKALKNFVAWITGTAVAAAPLIGSASDRMPDAPVFPVVEQSVPVVMPPPHTIRIEEYAPAGSELELALPTHIAFLSGLEIITEVENDRFVFRAEGSSAPWQVSPLIVNRPHSVTRCTVGDRFWADDTQNHRLIAFDDLAAPDFDETTAIAGVSLFQPHDVACSDDAGWLYALNPIAPIVFRLADFGVAETALDLSASATYSRALSMVDGTLFVVASAAGRVLEVHDFDAGLMTAYQSFGKLADAPAGSWSTTGFVVNDVERYDGWWYASNFFAPQYAAGTDHNRFKLVRFRSWVDFETGVWQELSHLLPDAVVPYFLTVHDGSLFVAGFHHTAPDDAVWKITTGILLDGFESGDTTAWSVTVP